MNRGRGKERGVDLAVALAVQSLAMAVFVRQWCCFKRWRERPFFSSPLFSFFLFCCVSHHLFIISVSSFFFQSPMSFLPSVFHSLLSTTFSPLCTGFVVVVLLSLVHSGGFTVVFSLFFSVTPRLYFSFCTLFFFS